MKSHDNRRARRRPVTADWLTPEQIAAAREQALKWREAWRAEVTARAKANGHNVLPGPASPAQRPARPTAQFASALARAEFGRFYWSDQQAAQLAEGLRKGPSNTKGNKVKRE